MGTSSFVTPMESRTPMSLEAMRPPAPLKPSSMLAFRMKRKGVLGGARRALAELGKNNSDYNLRLAETLLEVPRQQFLKKWNFDTVNEVPLASGQFQWTPAAPRSDSTTLTTAVELRLQPASQSTTAGDALRVYSRVTNTTACEETENKPVNLCGAQNAGLLTSVPTTAAPTIVVPTTSAPTTEAPTIEVPTTPAPTTSAPTTEAPTTSAPITAAISTALSTTTAVSTTIVPTIAAPTTSMPTTVYSLREPNALRRLSLGQKSQTKRRKHTSVRRQSLSSSQPIITDFLRQKKRPISSIKDTVLPPSPKKRMLAF